MQIHMFTSFCTKVISTNLLVTFVDVTRIKPKLDYVDVPYRLSVSKGDRSK